MRRALAWCKVCQRMKDDCDRKHRLCERCVTGMTQVMFRLHPDLNEVKIHCQSFYEMA